MSKYIKKLNFSELINYFSEDNKNPLVFYKNLCYIIEEYEPYINAFVNEEGRSERLLNEVKQLIDKYSDKNEKPPLYCLPIGIKDIFVADGFETHAGSALPHNLFAWHESSFVTKLKNAGAIIIGKTVTTEFAYFEPGPTSNPYNLKHTPGGSSSGSAAAVACGFCAMASGTQTIGSISRPASYCGVVGYKPSFARIPADGIIPFSPSLDHPGYFANSLKDICTIAEILCIDWNNSEAENQTKLPIIGVIKDGDYLLQADNEMINFYFNIINILNKKGYKIIEIEPFKDIASVNKAHKRLAAAELAKVHKDWFAEYESLYRQGTACLIKEGMDVEPDEIAKALEGRSIIKNRIESVMNDFAIDIIITPSAVNAAPKGLHSTGSPLMNLPWTYSGLPTLSIPAGKSQESLPLGIQIAGKYQNDEELIAFSSSLEKVFNELFT